MADRHTSVTLSQGYRADPGTLTLVAEHQSMAIIDIGSNSVRLVVYRQSAGVWQKIINEKCQCRLGEGVAINGLIQTERLQTALEVLSRFAMLIEHAKPDKVIAIATSAVRDADNGPEFVRDSSNILGVELLVLSGQSEARYAAEGVRWSIPDAKGLVADLGGSSLELTNIGFSDQDQGSSLPIGPLQLIDLFGTDRKAAKSYIDDQLRRAIEPLKDTFSEELSKVNLFAVGGSWRSLAQLHIQNSAYPIKIVHRYRPHVQEFGGFLRPVSFMSHDEAIMLDVAQADRRMALPYASLILRRLFKWTKCSQVEFCSTGIREGALALHADNKSAGETSTIYSNTVKSLVPNGGRFGPIDKAMEEWVSQAYAADLGGMQTMSKQRIWEACALADFGWNEHPSHKKTATYMYLLNSTRLPHDHHARAQLAAIQFYRHKGRGADLNGLEICKLLDRREQTSAKILGRIMHLGMQVCRSQAALLKMTRLQVTTNKIEILYPKSWPAFHASSIQSSCQMLSDACGLPVRLRPSAALGRS